VLLIALIFVNYLGDYLERGEGTLLSSAFAHHDAAVKALLENPNILVVLEKQSVSYRR